MYRDYVQADDQEEMKVLGVMGIYKESCKTILFSCKKMLFTQITLALILPLSLIFLANIHLSNLLFPNILQIRVYTQYFNNSTNIPSKYDGSISTQEFIHYFLFKSAYVSLLVVFSLLSTGVVTHTTVASICASSAGSSTVHNLKEMIATSNKAVFPRALKRLTLTFVWNFVAGLVYVLVAFFLMFLVFKTWSIVSLPKTWILYTIVVVLFLLFLAGLVYLQIVCQLAIVVSVVEEESGLGAMIRSGALMKGKARVAVIMFLEFQFCRVAIQQLFRTLMIDGVGDQSTSSSAAGKVISKVWFGVICLLVVMVLFLFGLVVQTVFYLVCKSYHHEIIDKSVLFDHSATNDEGCYLGDQFVPLKSKDGVLGQIDV